MAKKTPTADSLPFLINEIRFHSVDTSYEVKAKKKLKAWILRAIKKEHKKSGELSFNFCSDTYLLNMNKAHLKHDYYTDIITFDFSHHPVVSGDIYISIDRVKENAKYLQKTLSNELCRVIIHGVLHLCGYKDKKPADVKLMRDKEDYYLSLLS